MAPVFANFSSFSPRRIRIAPSKFPVFLFPFQGIVFFILHPFLYPLLRSRIIPCFLLSLAVLAILFTFTYFPQVALLALFHRGSFSSASVWINGTVLVLSEAAAIVAILFEAFLVDDTLVDIFDAVLIYHGFGALVAGGRVVHEPSSAFLLSSPDSVRSQASRTQTRHGIDAGDSDNPVRCLGKLYGRAVYSPFSCRQITEFILLIPLNLIPFIGAPLFLYLTGYRAGPFQHWRYFQLRGFDRKGRIAWIAAHRQQYTAFGTTVLCLQLIPVLNMLFLLTSAVGSALWAASLEQNRLCQTGNLERDRDNLNRASEHPSFPTPPDPLVFFSTSSDLESHGGRGQSDGDAEGPDRPEASSFGHGNGGLSSHGWTRSKSSPSSGPGSLGFNTFSNPSNIRSS